MGCSVGKPELESNEVASPQVQKKKIYSTTTPTARASRSLRFSSSTNAPSAERSNHLNPYEKGRRSLSLHNRTSQIIVDYINDPADTDQITAKITRVSPPTRIQQLQQQQQQQQQFNKQHKKSIDLKGSPPSLLLEKKITSSMIPQQSMNQQQVLSAVNNNSSTKNTTIFQNNQSTPHNTYLFQKSRSLLQQSQLQQQVQIESQMQQAQQQQQQQPFDTNKEEGRKNTPAKKTLPPLQSVLKKSTTHLEKPTTLS